MNTMACGILLILVCAISMACVESYSPPRCGMCNPRMCRNMWCRCGSYRDYCGCCSVCYKCPGERCSFVANDRCARGRCVGPQDISSFQAYNIGGQCL